MCIRDRDYPDVYAAVRAVRAFKEVRVLGERPLEIRLGAGEHVVGQGLGLVGPAFSGVRMRGEGINETQLTVVGSFT